MPSKIQPSMGGNIMEDPIQEKRFVKSEAPKELVKELLERGKELDEFADDHQGMIIGDRTKKIHAIYEGDELSSSE